jgi:DNA-binding transcriptional ArsR family regulator
MPISSNDFEKTERETSPLLLDILRSHPLNAYGLDELVEMLASMGRKLAIEEVERILALLEYGGKVESRVIDGVHYYRYREFSFFKPPIRPK